MGKILDDVFYNLAGQEVDEKLRPMQDVIFELFKSKKTLQSRPAMKVDASDIYLAFLEGRISSGDEYYTAADYEALDAKLSATEKERDQAIELMSMRYENLNRDGKTILDFQSVWISQSRRRIEKLELELAEAREEIARYESLNKEQDSILFGNGVIVCRNGHTHKDENDCLYCIIARLRKALEVIKEYLMGSSWRYVKSPDEFIKAALEASDEG